MITPQTFPDMEAIGTYLYNRKDTLPDKFHMTTRVTDGKFDVWDAPDCGKNPSIYPRRWNFKRGADGVFTRKLKGGGKIRMLTPAHWQHDCGKD